MKLSAPISAHRRGHPLELFPVFRRWPRSAARDLLYTALWNTLIALGISLALTTFGNWRASFLTLFGYSLLASHCVGFPIHGALRVLEKVVPPTTGRTNARLLDLAAIVLCAAFGIAVSGAILRGALPILNADALGGLLAFGLAIGVAILLVLVAGERRIERQTLEARRQEQLATTARLLAEAQLRALQAQIEPHFLYNTLASAQVLTRSDPARADAMLGNLIQYLRHSLPRTEDAPSTLGEELERSRAYLDILAIRMGPRLSLQVDVPDELQRLVFPPMMLQTLVENAIKHGLEPKPGGGTVWILARAVGGEQAQAVAVTVADDGRGFSSEGAGTGIGLSNVRERLRLAYGNGASFAIVANFPSGVAATITVPLALQGSGGRHAA